MAYNITPTHKHEPPVVADLRKALAGALENLPDVAPEADQEFVANCAADIAAMAQLLSDDGNGLPNIVAYL